VTPLVAEGGRRPADDTLHHDAPAGASSFADVAVAPASVARCPHCGTAVEGEVDAFCCHGCEMAAAIIHGAGLDRYYDEREAYAPRPEPGADGWSAIPVATADDGSCEVRLTIDGLRCASCVWVVERVLETSPGVREATVSYATGRATLRWDPATTDLAALAGRVAALGYRPRALGAERAPDRDLMVRFGVATALGLGLMAFYEPLYGGWWYGGMAARFAQLFRWASLALATPLAFWCAAPYFAGAWAGLRRRILHMDVPIALGVAVLYAHGFVQTLRSEDAYLDSLGMLVALLLGGRLLESRGRRRAAEAATALVASAPRTARRSTGGHVETVPVDELRAGDLVDVAAGEELAADGTIETGGGQLRMALLTGEAEPVAIGAGDRVVAGTVLLDGAVTMRVEATGSETVLQRMAAQLHAAADRGMRPTATDRIAPAFTAATLAIALLTLGGWWWARGLEVGIANMVAVLVVACPCALALAHPLAAAAGLGAAARRGILFRDADSLLAMGEVDVAALDKTGTVTAGALTVAGTDDATLRIAAGLERYSAHPIARAITGEAARREIPLPQATEVHETPGAGISGIVDGRRWTLRSSGPGRVVLVDDSTRERSIRLADAARSDSRAAVAALASDGLEVVLLTGDHPDVARRVAVECGIGAVNARLTPEAKAEWIEARRASGRRVLFAGDGLNDGPALAAADVGVAMGTGAASSVLVADGVISADSLAPLLAARRAARAAARSIRANQWRSIVYNVASVGAAAAGLVNPLVAALLMPFSSLVVIWGAARVEARVRKEER
jgi:Cu2+-exporting ATPase